MAHYDICPCKHGVWLCERECRQCLIELYGCSPEKADEIMRESFGPVIDGPHVESGRR